jgi:uncharacterized membrane protein
MVTMDAWPGPIVWVVAVVLCLTGSRELADETVRWQVILLRLLLLCVVLSLVYQMNIASLVEMADDWQGHCRDGDLASISAGMLMAWRR